MRVRSGFGWLGCFALVVACGGNTLGSGVDTRGQETGGTRSLLPGDGGQPDGFEPSGAAGEGEFGAPNGGAPDGGVSPRGGSNGGGSPAAGGVPGVAPMGGAAVGPPTFPGFGGGIFGGGGPIMGGAPSAGGFGAFGGMVVLRSVPVPLPEPGRLEDCSYSEACDGQSSCTCSYQCALDSPFAYCFEDTEREPDGTWSCTYSASGRADAYRVGGVDLATACHVVADLAGGEPEYAGPESCAPEQRLRSEDSCNYTDRCTRPILLDDGRMASFGWPRYIGCSEISGGLCLVDNVAYHADDIDVADRCEALLPYAEERPEPVFEDPPVCETTIVEEVVGACQTETLCSEMAEVAPAVWLEHQEIFYASCESDGRGGSRCACAREGEALRFDTPWPTDDATACDVARSACEGEFEFTGEVECRQRYISADSISCQTEADCVRPGSIAGADVVAIAVLEASCVHRGDAYSCSCVSGNHSAQIPVVGPTSFDGCARAVDACRDAVELSFIGNNGSISEPSP